MTVIKHETAHQFDRVATLVVPPSKGCAAAESGGHACGAAHAAMAGGPLRVAAAPKPYPSKAIL